MESNSALVDTISLKEHDKLRGGFYTSSKVAAWLCDWAIRNPSDNILEPSCGDGVFLSAAVDCLRRLGATNLDIKNQLVGIELFPLEAEKSQFRIRSQFISPEGMVYCGDFFEWATLNDAARYQCIVGNPPFIRYQNFPEPSRSIAMKIMKSVGLSPNKLTNIWVPFVVASTNLLLPGGRLALVLPAELLQVSYSAQLRSFLINNFESIDVVTCNQMIFDKVEQEVVLLLADKRQKNNQQSNTCSINLLETDSLENMLEIDMLSQEYKRDRKIVNHDNEKWLKYFLTQAEILLMREIRNSSIAVDLKHYGKIDVGVVTGKNDFFVLSKKDIEAYSLQKYTIPLIGRSYQLKGSIITTEDYSALAEADHKVFLFYPRPLLNDGLSLNVRKYINYGELNGFHEGYKCSVRNPWYVVPSVWNPDFFFFRQIYDFPRIVYNSLNATSTDTIHRLKCNVNKQMFMSSYYTHLTAASSEIEGRSYGGGVLELEPTEAERLLMPSNLIYGLEPSEIDKLIRAGRLDEVLYAHDKMILIKEMGLSRKDCQMLRSIWEKMRNRRQSRKSRGKKI